METKYTTIFSSELKCIVSEEKDLHLSVASLDSLRAFLPNIDTDKNIDLLPISTNAFVAGRVNRNGDVVDNKTAVEIAKYFVNKPINLEHNRTQVVGCILNYGFNTFGSEEPMTEQEAINSKDPFNIALGGVMWKVVNKDIANLVEESNDPTSPNYMRVSASWELGFNEYQFVLLDNDKKNIMEGRVVEDADEMEKLKSKSRAFGGTGILANGQKIYRLVTGNIIPLGIGLTGTPAADVVGVATNEKKPDLAILSLKQEEKEDDNKSEAKIEEKINISQNQDLTVNSDTNNNNIMKITKIEDITAESLKEIQASQVAEFIAEEIKKASETFDTERKEKEEAIKAATEKYEALTKDNAIVKEELEKVKATLAALEEEKAAKIREEVFNTRMASFDEEYDLSDEDRQVLASDIKDLNDETFAAYKNKMTVLMKEKSKAVKKAKMAKEAEMKEKTMATEVVAKVEVVASDAKEVVNQALDNGIKQATDVPATATANEPSLYDRYKKAFSIEGFDVS